MATAEGKITTARLRRGDRIVVKVWEGGNAGPSPTKIKDAVKATVRNVKRARPDRYDRKARYDIEIDTDLGEHLTIEHVTGSQTFWAA